MYDKMGVDFCYDISKFYLQLSHFRGICVDHCPKMYYPISILQDDNISYSDKIYHKFLSVKRCVRCPDVLFRNQDQECIASGRYASEYLALNSTYVSNNNRYFNMVYPALIKTQNLCTNGCAHFQNKVCS